MSLPVHSEPGGAALAPEFTKTSGPNSLKGSVEVRFLRLDDIEQLMVLENKKWTEEQAARPEDMARRIETYPRFCFGAFSSTTGEALASLFVKPMSQDKIRAANTWADCAKAEDKAPAGTLTLFGISLTSIDEIAVNAIVEFFMPLALQGGWQEIYLGSPLPGLRAWKRQNPDTPIEDYVYARHNNRPLDPQLYYYHEKGFTHIEACKPNYFPHERSLDYGAVIRADLSLSI